jgi:hypothetical protein
MATRNRYAEIMANYQQAQPFSFTGMPSTYTGGFTGYPSNYTGGFTPYQRLVTPQPAVPVEVPTSSSIDGRGGRNGQEPPSAWSQLSPAEQAAYYAANPTEGKIALAAQDYFGSNPFGFLSKSLYPDKWYDSRLIKQGYDPESFAFGPPDPKFSSQAAAAARNEALQAAITAANADTGLVANPMSTDPSQRVVSTPVVTAPPVMVPTITEGLLNTPIVETPVVAPVPVVTAPPPTPVQMVDITERWNSEENPDPGQGWTLSGGRGGSWTRTISVPAGGGIGGSGGSGGYTVGGYTPGSQAAAAAASGQFAMGPGTPGFNSGMSGLYKGGHVSMMHLQGPNPMGPDDGYGALKDGEYVINDKAVKKYGIELMNLINSGKISKGKLRGLLEM